jgi:hypothetical protein
MKKIIGLLTLIFLFAGCEKDDICDPGTATTPNLVIEFYDYSQPTLTKNVVGLKVTGDGMTTAFTTFNGTSKINIPLKTTQDSTKFSLVLNSTSTTSSNEDFLQFNYTPSDVYVSRACGYKKIFELNATDGVIQSDPATPDTFWIKDIKIQTNSINNQNEVHIKIYF